MSTAFARLLALAAVAQVAPGQLAVEGIVRDAEGRPIEGAIVAVRPADPPVSGRLTWSSAATGADGAFSLTVAQPGEFVLDAEAEGFVDADVPVVVEGSGESTPLTVITLVPERRVTVVVASRRSQAIGGVTVQALPGVEGQSPLAVPPLFRVGARASRPRYQETDFSLAPGGEVTLELVGLRPDLRYTLECRAGGAPILQELDAHATEARIELTDTARRGVSIHGMLRTDGAPAERPYHALVSYGAWCGPAPQVENFGGQGFVLEQLPAGVPLTVTYAMDGVTLGSVVVPAEGPRDATLDVPRGVLPPPQGVSAGPTPPARR